MCVVSALITYDPRNCPGPLLTRCATSGGALAPETPRAIQNTPLFLFPQCIQIFFSIFFFTTSGHVFWARISTSAARSPTTSPTSGVPGYNVVVPGWLPRILACPGPDVVPDVGIQIRDQDAQPRGVKHSTMFVVCHVSSDVDKQVPTIKELKKLSRTIAELDARPTAG